MREHVIRSIRLLPLVLFLLALFWIPQRAAPALVSNDAYYHARLAAMGPRVYGADRFGWLPYTRLADRWVDHEFAWHLLATPFSQRDPEAGARIFTTLQDVIL